MALPVLEIDYRRYPALADNIWQAQMAGHPQVLTYSGPDVVTRKEARTAAMHFELDGSRQSIPRILSRDEYPFACTLEGGRRSWVGHIPGRENSAQGGLIAAFLKRHWIVPGGGARSRFQVIVVHHPKGPVRVAAKARR